MVMRCAAALAALTPAAAAAVPPRFGSAVGGDPSSGWLSYAVWQAPGLVTRISTTWNVPEGKPTAGGSNAPGWWYGTQTADGDGALVQPILACDYQTSDCRSGTYEIFNGVYDWTGRGWYSSSTKPAKAGDTIVSHMTCTPTSCEMYIENQRTGESVTTPYQLQNGNHGNETQIYFVLEHAPYSCDAFPPNGVCTFQNIAVEVDGKPVTPKWEAKQEESAMCGSKFTVVDSKTLSVTWNGGSPPVAATAKGCGLRSAAPRVGDFNGTCAPKVCDGKDGPSGEPGTGECCQVSNTSYECCWGAESCLKNIGCRC